MKTIQCIFVALLSICVFPSDITAEAAAGVGKSKGKTTAAKDSSSAGSSQSSVYGSPVPATVYQPGYNTPGSASGSFGVGGGQSQYTSSAYGSPNYISNGGNVPVQQQYSAPGSGSFGGANGQYIQQQQLQQQQQQQSGFGGFTTGNINGQTFSTSTVNSPSSAYQTSYVSRPAPVSAGYGSPGYVQSQGRPGFGFGVGSGSGVGSGFATAAPFDGGNNFNYQNQNQRPQQQFQNSANYISQSSPSLGYGSPNNYVNNNNNNNNYVQQTAGGFSTGLNYNRFNNNNNNNANYQNQFQQNQGGYTGGNNFQSTNYQYNRPGFSSGSTGFGTGTGTGISGGNIGYNTPGTNYVSGSSGSSSGVSGGYSK